MRRHPRRLRHRIGIPRGILRHVTLLILKKSPMSGSELMEEIERYTDWKPSPGSIYPLLSQLSGEGVIEPYPDEDPSLKRFTLTKEGRKHFEELKWHDEHVRSRNKSMRKIYWRLHMGMPEEVYESLAALLNTVEETYINIAGSSEKTRCYKEILEKASNQLGEISE